MTRASVASRRSRRDARNASVVDGRNTSTVKSDPSEGTDAFFLLSTIPSAAHSPPFDMSLSPSSSPSAASPAVRRLPVRRKEALKGLCKFVTTDDTCQFRRCRFPHSQEELEAALASPSEDIKSAFEDESATGSTSQYTEGNAKSNHTFAASTVALNNVYTFACGDNRKQVAGKMANLVSAPIERVKVESILEDDEMGGFKSCGSRYTLWDGPRIPFCFSK